jgi:hypothetical protein
MVFATPDAFDPILANMPAIPLQQHRDAAVTVAAVLFLARAIIDALRRPSSSRLASAVAFPFAVATSICRSKFTICSGG